MRGSGHIYELSVMRRARPLAVMMALTATTAVHGVEIAVRYAPLNLAVQGVSRLQATDDARGTRWFEQNIKSHREPEVSLFVPWRQEMGFEYRNQRFGAVHQGRIGKTLCTFFGCFMAGSNLLSGYETSEQIGLNFRNHGLFATYRAENPTAQESASSYSLGVNWLQGDATATGAGFAANQSGSLPLLGMRITRQFFLDPTSAIELVGSPSYYYAKRGSAFLGSLTAAYNHQASNFVRVSIGLEWLTLKLSYHSESTMFEMRSTRIDPFIQLHLTP